MEVAKEMEAILSKIDMGSNQKIEDDHELYTVLDKWYEEDEHRAIVNTILQIPEEKWTQKLIIELACAYNNTYRCDETIELLKRYETDEEKTDARWYYMYAYAYHELEDYVQAMEYLDKSLKLNPTRESTLELLRECQEDFAHATGLVKRRKARSKKYALTYDEYEDDGKDAKDLMDKILTDKELPQLEEVIIGYWGDPFDVDCQVMIDIIKDKKEQFSHIKSLFIGDMDYEDCEVSWIEQGNYDGILEALPNLEALTIKGSTNLVLGKLKSENLKHLEIICGGLPKSVLQEIQEADLPNLETLNLYIGVDNYGCDFEKEDIETFLNHTNFTNLKYLGLNDCEWQDEVVELVCKSKYMKQLEVLDFSNGTLTDKGGAIILETIPKYENIKKVDMHHHYMSEEMMEKLKTLSCEVDVSEENDPDDDYLYPMLTE